MARRMEACRNTDLVLSGQREQDDDFVENRSKRVYDEVAENAVMPNSQGPIATASGHLTSAEMSQRIERGEGPWADRAFRLPPATARSGDRRISRKKFCDTAGGKLSRGRRIFLELKQQDTDTMEGNPSNLILSLTAIFASTVHTTLGFGRQVFPVELLGPDFTHGRSN